MGKTSMKITRQILLITADILSVIIAAAFAFICTFPRTRWLEIFTTPVVAWWGANVLITIPVFLFFNLYNIMFSSISFSEVAKIFLSCVIFGVLNFAYAVVLVPFGMQITMGTALVYTIAIFCLTTLSRSSKRLYLHFRGMVYMRRKKSIRVMIVGGGSAGAALIREMQGNPQMKYSPVCIADDNAVKKGTSLRGVKVAGTTKEIAKLVDKYRVREIFVTMPSVEKRKQREIVQRCQDTGLPVKVLPGIYQMALGQVTVAKLRQVDVTDLLGRDPIKVNLQEITGYIQDKVVLVTGGGGSIGSELCRQIATRTPKTLIILDEYENTAYEIEQELKREHPQLNLLTLIASVRDERKMRDVFEKYRPQIVFHAAAHKHVPLMETSPNEAVKNNVFGTLNVARCADEYAAETFVLISTDKAVNPTNIMGATKRICEMIVQTIGKHSKNTNFVAVRFGNVLGSNGSVIPLFKKQIEAGGPVTVTHKDIIRYFMTIPEAVSLVLQAGAYAKGGQIFVLDMGEPVRIYDLAYNLIRMSGYEPNVDIDIVCTGLRPGEKLFEERLMEEEGLQKTANGLISVARPIELDETHLWAKIEELRKGANEESEEMKKAVKELVPTYTIDKRDSIAEALSHVTQTEQTEEKVG